MRNVLCNIHFVAVTEKLKELKLRSVTSQKVTDLNSRFVTKKITDLNVGSVAFLHCWELFTQLVTKFCFMMSLVPLLGRA